MIHHDPATGRTLLGIWAVPFSAGGDHEVRDAIDRCVCRCTRAGDNAVVAEALNAHVERLVAASTETTPHAAP